MSEEFEVVKYEHVKCECGGIIGMYNRRSFTCAVCHKEYKLQNLDYDACSINDMTGWTFPIKFKDNK